MTPELTVLTLAALLQDLQRTLMPIPTNLEVSARKTSRLIRAMDDYLMPQVNPLR